MQKPRVKGSKRCLLSPRGAHSRKTVRVIPVSLALMVIDCEVAVFCNADISASNLVNHSLRVMDIHLLDNRGSFIVLALSRFVVGFM